MLHGDAIAPARLLVRVCFYPADDSVFLDGEYLIRGVAGRILWIVLTLYRDTGRSTFSNRELRLHPFLKVSGARGSRDNLETRLLGLQRRLDARASAFRLHREQRGILHLVCEAELELGTIE